MGRQRQSLQHISDGIFWKVSLMVKNVEDATIIKYQPLNILSLQVKSLYTLLSKQLDVVL